MLRQERKQRNRPSPMYPTCATSEDRHNVLGLILGLFTIVGGGAHDAPFLPMSLTTCGQS